MLSWRCQPAARRRKASRLMPASASIRAGRHSQGAAPLCVCAEQQEERSKEDPVSGVGKDAEQRVVKRF